MFTKILKNITFESKFIAGTHYMIENNNDIISAKYGHVDFYFARMKL